MEGVLLDSRPYTCRLTVCVAGRLEVVENTLSTEHLTHRVLKVNLDSLHSVLRHSSVEGRGGEMSARSLIV